nr:MAG: capsid protein [Cressdnaviricota sp.]
MGYKSYAHPSILGTWGSVSNALRTQAKYKKRRGKSNWTKLRTVVKAAGRFRAGPKKSLNQKAIHEGTGGSFSKFFYGRRRIPKRMRAVYKNCAKNYQVINNSGRLTANSGSQSFNGILTMFSTADLTGFSTNISANKTNKFLAMNCSAELMLSNQDEGNCRIVLYDVICRRDITQSNISDPANAFKNSLADEGGSNANWSSVGTTPFASDLFTQFYKVLKITHIILGAGQFHTHRVHFGLNRQFDNEQLQYTPNGIKGATCFTVAMIYGAPYNDSTTKTQVSTGQVTVDFVSKKQYSYTWVQDQDTNYYLTNNLVGFTVGEDILSIASGAPLTPDIPA